MEYEQCLHNGKRPSVKKTSGPDGLEAWLVALAACFINFVMAGLGRSSAILYVAVIDIFQTDRKEASLPFTVRSSTRNLLGPVVGILGQKYGARPIIIAGGIIGTLSAASCFFMNDIVLITIVWGGINGIGTALMTTLPQVVIGQYFEKYRATASGMAFSGGCVGSFLFPVLIEYFLYTYDLGGTFLIIAGFIMHVIPAALILKTPSWWQNGKEPETEELTATCETAQVMNVSAFRDDNEDRERSFEYIDGNLSQVDSGYSEVNKPHFERHSFSERLLETNIDSDFLWQNRFLLAQLLTNNFTLQYQLSDIKHEKFYPTVDASIKEIEFMLRKLDINSSTGDNNMMDVCPPSALLISEAEFVDKCAGSKIMHFTNGTIKSGAPNGNGNLISINYFAYYVDKLFERDKIIIFQEFPEEQHKGIKTILEELEKLHNHLKNYGNYSILPPKNTEILENGGDSIKSSEEHPNTFCSHIKTAIKLYKKPLFLLICLCRCVHFVTFVPAVTIIVDFGMDKGLPAEAGKYVINALSLGDLLGRLCFGWITDRGYVSLPTYMLVVMILSGAATVTVPLMQSKAAIMTSIAVFGFLQGSVFVRHPVLVARYLGKHEQYIAMGCINLFSGLIGFVLPIYIGFFRDTIGSYDGLFYVNGSVGAVIGLLWLFEPYFLKILSKSVPSDNQPCAV